MTLAAIPLYDFSMSSLPTGISPALALGRAKGEVDAQQWQGELRALSKKGVTQIHIDKKNGVVSHFIPASTPCPGYTVPSCVYRYYLDAHGRRVIEAHQGTTLTSSFPRPCH